MRRVIRRQTTTIKIVSVKLTWTDEAEPVEAESARPEETCQDVLLPGDDEPPLLPSKGPPRLAQEAEDEAS